MYNTDNYISLFVHSSRNFRLLAVSFRCGHHVNSGALGYAGSVGITDEGLRASLRTSSVES